MATRKRTGTGQAQSMLDGSEIALLDALIPGLYAKATGKVLGGKPGDRPPDIDTVAVDRLLKVLELRAKYKELGKRKTGAKGAPSWGGQ